MHIFIIFQELLAGTASCACLFDPTRLEDTRTPFAAQGVNKTNKKKYIHGGVSFTGVVRSKPEGLRGPKR